MNINAKCIAMTQGIIILLIATFLDLTANIMLIKG